MPWAGVEGLVRLVEVHEPQEEEAGLVHPGGVPEPQEEEAGLERPSGVPEPQAGEVGLALLPGGLVLQEAAEAVYWMCQEVAAISRVLVVRREDGGPGALMRPQKTAALEGGVHQL